MLGDEWSQALGVSVRVFLEKTGVWQNNPGRKSYVSRTIQEAGSVTQKQEAEAFKPSSCHDLMMPGLHK